MLSYGSIYTAVMHLRKFQTFIS